MIKKIVQVSQLGKFGDFGNQLHQYAFARTYAEMHGAELQTPNWLGYRIFNLKHTPIKCQLPRTPLDKIPWGEVNIDLFGYFQNAEFFKKMDAEKMRSWFTFKDKWIDYPTPIIDTVAHLRRGDYVTKYPNVFCIIKKDSYFSARKRYRLNAISFVSQDEALLDNKLDSDLMFMPDFLTMVRSNVLLRSNSTFGFWAGFFQNKKVYSPKVKGLVGWSDVPFVEGNHSAICNATDDIIFGEGS